MRVFGMGPLECGLILFLLVFFGLQIWMLSKVFQRTGMPGGYAFLLFVPYVGYLIVFGILAFSDWPALQRSAVTLPSQPPPSPMQPPQAPPV